MPYLLLIALLMTLPGVALFYGGMVRKKNVLATFILLKIIDLALGLRVEEEDEREGLDIRLHGESVG